MYSSNERNFNLSLCAIKNPNNIYSALPCQLRRWLNSPIYTKHRKLEPNRNSSIHSARSSTNCNKSFRCEWLISLQHEQRNGVYKTLRSMDYLRFTINYKGIRCNIWREFEMSVIVSVDVKVWSSTSNGSVSDASIIEEALGVRPLTNK